MNNQQPAQSVDLESMLELNNIYFMEVSARRWNSNPEDQEDPPDRTTQSLQVLQNIDEQKMAIRGRLTVKTPQALLIADAVAIYKLKEEDGTNDDAAPQEVEPSAESLRIFAENEGVPAIFPFLREAIHSSARKISVKAPVLRTLRRGHVELKSP
ncbi:hypothetical protein ACGF0J_37515 [Nonomuraea sp. NPDC047897]|uniref:hypothetical protein n=1 Tax=Nonomuraea sp. NPDC047897 TaxID=3364346 RepID=UPI00371E5AC0